MPDSMLPLGVDLLVPGRRALGVEEREGEKEKERERERQIQRERKYRKDYSWGPKDVTESAVCLLSTFGFLPIRTANN